MNNEGNRTDLPHDQIARGNGEKEDINLIEYPTLDDYAEMDDVPRDPNYREEAATEVSPALDTRRMYPPDVRDDESRRQMENIETLEEEEQGSTALGWTALVISILSLFFLPVLAGTIGVITGFFAYRNGSRTLGMWAIAVGLFAIVMALFFTPFVVR